MARNEDTEGAQEVSAQGTSSEQPTSQPPTSRPPLLRRRKFWAIGGGSTLLVLVVLLIAVVWFYSGEIQSGAFEVDHEPDEFDLEIVSMVGTLITLTAAEGDPDLDQPGTMGLRGESGYLHVGEIVSIFDDKIERAFAPFDGELSEGDRVRYERSAFPENPRRAYGLDYTDVVYQATLGPMPAWFVPGESSTWAIMVHGRTATREETLRALSIANRTGLPVLSIAYRNDPDAPQDPGGEYQFGINEWQDLHSAVEYALANGADDVVLFGFSMGGGLVSHFMIESELAENTVGLVLDAPMLNLTSALRLAGEQRGLPQWLPWLAARLTSVRFDVDWGELDVREELLAMDVPMLLFHGTGDETIPVSQSDEFAEDAGTNVTYVRVEEAEHVGAWNVDPQGYESAIVEWLDEVGVR